MVLIFIWDPIPGTPGGIIAFLALALFGIEMLRRQTEVEFPDARRGDATAALRAAGKPFATGANAGKIETTALTTDRFPTSCSGSGRCGTTARLRPRSTTRPRRTCCIREPTCA